MLVTGMVSLEQAVSPDSIDYKTLFLLFGMMVVVGFLRLSGFFQQMTTSALRRIRTPAGLLILTIALSGVLSAFLINDIVCLTLTPLVLHLARRLRFDPIPHLIALATAANVGSTGTITGNPQNIYIGSHSGIPYLRFAERLLPVAAIGLLLNFLVVAFVYRRSLFGQAVSGDIQPEREDAVLLRARSPTARRAIAPSRRLQSPMAPAKKRGRHIDCRGPFLYRAAPGTNRSGSSGRVVHGQDQTGESLS